jgi:RNA polymerase sigma-70 factor (ECF subfamily)
LLERIRDAADAPAWEDFWRHYGALIFTFAKRRGCSDATAQDVVQDVMFEVFKGREVLHYDPAKGRFRDWLGGVVRHRVFRRRQAPGERIRAAGGSCDQVLADQSEPVAAADHEWQELFDDAVLDVLLNTVRDEVSPATYQAFELTMIQDLPGAEVARATGLSRNAVYLARKRVLKRLRELGVLHRTRKQLAEQVQRVLVSHLPGDVERTLASSLDESLRRRREEHSG